MNNNTQFDARQFTKGRYIKAEQLDKRQAMTVTVQRATPTEFEGQKAKLVLGFSETEQELPLNKTQTETMIEVFGSDFRTWIGKTIGLKQGRATYLGKPVPTVVIEEAEPAAAPEDDDAPF